MRVAEKALAQNAADIAEEAEERADDLERREAEIEPAEPPDGWGRETGGAGGGA